MRFATAAFNLLALISVPLAAAEATHDAHEARAVDTHEDRLHARDFDAAVLAARDDDVDHLNHLHARSQTCTLCGATCTLKFSDGSYYHLHSTYGTDPMGNKKVTKQQKVPCS